MTISAAKNDILSLLLERDSVSLKEVLETFPTNKNPALVESIYKLAFKELEEGQILKEALDDEWVLVTKLQKIPQSVTFDGNFAVTFANLVNKILEGEPETPPVDSFSLTQRDFELALVLLARQLINAPETNQD